VCRRRSWKTIWPRKEKFNDLPNVSWGQVYSKLNIFAMLGIKSNTQPLSYTLALKAYLALKQ
jgi:hypothetical protein